MSDSHDVPFRGEHDQPCPNCGAIVDEFKESSRYDSWGGYECADCDVRWSWEEWADGVEKRPDPDPQHEAADLDTRQLCHAHRDIVHAVENNRFAVETPRVHVEDSAFDRVDIAISRDTQEYHSWDHERAISFSPPYLDVTVEWTASNGQHYGLVQDLRAHGALEGPCILYGDMHLWRMSKQRGVDLYSEHPVDGGAGACTARFEWRGVEPVGWR
jgi:hypothetical protein